MFKTVVFLSVTFITLNVASDFSFGDNTHEIARAGGKMDAAEKVLLEEKLKQSPEDIESRTKLLGYYFITGRADADANEAKTRHIVWFIEHAPQSEVLGLPYGKLDKILQPEGFQQAKAAWLAALDSAPNDLAALSNAAQFFIIHDRKLSEQFLLRGKQADTKNPKWASSLGQLYMLGLSVKSDDAAKKENAAKAFDQFEQAYEHSDEQGRESLLVSLAKSAMDAGISDKAKEYAERMLADNASNWNSGNRIHHGNLILGRIALEQNDIDEAKARLLAAGRTTGSPQLSSFGPNMLLAKRLLELGESEVVLEYFSLCDQFWKSPRRKLDRWIDDVKANRTPDFGANLSY